MADGENRLSRWSRLKRKGGAAQHEELAAERDAELKKQAAAKASEDTVRLPGGVRVRNFVPAMAPLAPEPEPGDDRLSRGIGHAPAAKQPSVPDGEAPAAPAPEPAPDSETLFDDIPEEPMTEQEQRVAATLPPLESLDQNSDFSPFMQNGVPEFLKRRAMRMLWRADPLFAFRDGLDDYDEDFNVAHTLIAKTVGNYRVGRGHLSDQELNDMMPEEARRAFDADEDAEDAEAEAAADAAEPVGADDAPAVAADSPEDGEKTAEPGPSEAESAPADAHGDEPGDKNA